MAASLIAAEPARLLGCKFLGSGGVPLGDWKDLHDPRTGKSLDLSFALKRFPIVGINKDIYNSTILR